jgi:hypothetical protein
LGSASSDRVTQKYIRDACRGIARIRDACRGIAIGVEADGDEFWLFLFAKASPHETTFLQLRRRPLVLDIVDDSAWSMPRHADRREYDFLPPIIRTERDLSIPDDSDMFVRTGMVMRGKVVGSPHAAVGFERFLRANRGAEKNELVVRKNRKRYRRVDATTKEGIMLECPWLSDDDFPREKAAPKKRRVRERDGPKFLCDAESANGDREYSALGSDDDAEPDAEIDNADDAMASVEAVAAHDLVRIALEWVDDEPLYFWSGHPYPKVTPATSPRGRATAEVPPWNTPFACNTVGYNPA